MNAARRFWLCWVVAAAAAASAVWGAEATSGPAVLLEQSERDFKQNTAMGAALMLRQGTEAELAHLQMLADRGLAAAREAAERYPDDAQAHHLLGRWLLYGYRVWQVREVVVTPEAARSTRTQEVVQGLADDPEAGLKALKRAMELQAANPRYAIDYGAALVDCRRLVEAASHLKSLWAGRPDFSPADRLKVALLLSRVAELEGRLGEARAWVYSGLEANPANAAMVQHLRWLDQALPEAMAAAAEAQRRAEEEQAREAEESQPAESEEAEPAPATE